MLSNSPEPQWPTFGMRFYIEEKGFDRILAIETPGARAT